MDTDITTAIEVITTGIMDIPTGITAITPIRAIGPIDITIGIMIATTTSPIGVITAVTIGTIIIATIITLTQAIARIGIGTDSLLNRKIQLLPLSSSTHLIL